eukprot:TRINITY_DN21511_c0_g1_i1.p1 TRINITY_DN21511_c0_g1~~TRINITY_DN21511_c0_g1_i1.p1  ORF type:complete len:499 (+),score=107.68 TRINITY_DN21511_c0_g1_i1:65-1498(+)
MENVFPRTNLDRYARELSTIAEDFKWVHQYRFVEFFVKNCYDDLPKDWIESLEEEDEPSIRAMVGGGVKKDWPESLKTFVQDCESLRLRNRKEIDKPKQLDTEMKRTLSEKKQHEVAHMAEGIHETVTRTPKKTAVILDIGSGQGYLPTVLAHKWGYDVVAVEACEGNVKKGEEREALITQRKRKREALTNQKEGVVSYHPAYLSPDTTASELDKLLSAKNIPPTTPVCLTGLHSCGDLTPLVLKLFSASPRISSLSIVGCCYYKMGWPTPSAFPMSKPMADLATLLGPTGAQLACENSMRWPVMDAPEWQHTKDLSLNRAVLEVVLHRLYPTLVESIGIRGVSRKVTKLPFMAYAKHCLARLKYRRLDLSNATEPVDGGGHARTEEASEDLPPPLVDPTDLYLADTYAAYAPSMHRLVIWLTLRECISPILEALFIVDRALYLRDALPDTAVSVSAVFDKQESPRNVMISAVKGSA